MEVLLDQYAERSEAMQQQLGEVLAENTRLNQLLMETRDQLTEVRADNALLIERIHKLEHAGVESAFVPGVAAGSMSAGSQDAFAAATKQPAPSTGCNELVPAPLLMPSLPPAATTSWNEMSSGPPPGPPPTAAEQPPPPPRPILDI